MGDLPSSPLLLLYQLDSRCRRNARPLPQQIEVKTTWDAVGFRLGAFQLAADMSQVKEILTQVSLCRLPGVKPWVKGVANVRGTLLPIFDLHGLLLGETVRMTNRSRVLVVQHHGIHAGLVVDEVFGMRHFLPEEHSDELSGFGSLLQPRLEGMYRQGASAWGVIDLHGLLGTAEFAAVAA